MSGGSACPKKELAANTGTGARSLFKESSLRIPGVGTRETHQTGTKETGRSLPQQRARSLANTANNQKKEQH